MHLIREGHFDLVDTFRKEANLKLDPSLKENFAEMYYIIEHLRKKDLKPALEWAKKRRNELEVKGSSLEFRLCRLEFIRILLSSYHGKFGYLYFRRIRLILIHD